MNRRRLAVHALLATGGLLLALAAVGQSWFATHPVVGILIEPGFALGLVLVLLAFFPARRANARLAMGLGLSVLAGLATVAVLEVGLRVAGFDFYLQDYKRERIPPYYRQPRVPIGPGFYRRRGPQEWTGRSISTWLRVAGATTLPAYRDEPAVTVRYDAHGFRNEEPLDDWEIAIAGDSFTELGFLPYEDLFTTRLARTSGRRVRNLGVSQTGPLTQLHYLRSYGVAPSLTDAVVVFFEGNDTYDLEAEYIALQRWEASRQRHFRRIRKQPSLLGALADWLSGGPIARKPWPTPLPVFDFQSREGTIPVTVYQVAPALEDLDASFDRALRRFLSDYQAFGLRQGVRTWLAYMPCKGRVLHARLTPSEAGTRPFPVWAPTELPRRVAEECTLAGVRFIDLTPPLEAAARDRGELVFNPMIDTHLNARGSALVAEELARWLAGPTAAGAQVAGTTTPSAPR